MKKYILPVVVTAFILGVAFLLTKKNDIPAPSGPMSTVDVTGKQIIEIQAKGGYNPKQVMAKADVPTIIRMKTEGTFDCSSSLSIPSLGKRLALQPTGTTDIEVPSQKAGSSLKGVCAMGMYSFAVNFN
jgi:plastocyanin domain-containing protein